MKITLKYFNIYVITVLLKNIDDVNIQKYPYF